MRREYNNNLKISILLIILNALTWTYCSAKVTVANTEHSVILSNANIRAEFTKEGKFDILSMKYADGRELVKTGDNQSPWTITYLGTQGENPVLEPAGCAEYKGYKIESNDTSKTLVFEWYTRIKYDGEHYPIKMYVSLSDKGDLLKWNLEASVPQNWTITAFSFPNISLKRPIDAKVITSGGWGNEYQLEQNGAYEANYPSYSASMQMIMLDDGKGAFYYSTEDFNACGKKFQVKESKGTVRFTLDVVTSAGWATNNLFKIPWTTVTGVDEKGWSAAALRWYRPFALQTEWGSKPLSERNIPKWLMENDLWLRAKYLNDTTVASVNKSIDYFGESICFHWYFWHHYSYDSHYPEYFPAQPEFASIIEQVKKRNCEVVPYINGRLWDSGTDSYQVLNGKEASCRKPDGTLYTEVYPTSMVLNTVTCPSSPIWRNIILNLADRIQNELHTNGLYIDQIAAAAPQPCYAKNHNHPAGGGEFWFHSYRDMIADLKKSHLKKDNIVFSEENAECYIPSFDILLTVNTPHNKDCKIVPLYPLIYSDRVLTSAFTYTPYTDITSGDFRYENMQCFLYGSQLGWVDPRLLWVNKKSEYEAKFLLNLTKLRKDQHDVFIGGRYVREFIPTGDNPVIDIPIFGKDNVVKGSEWISPKGKRVMYVVNSDSRPHTVMLPNGETITIKSISGDRINL